MDLEFTDEYRYGLGEIDKQHEIWTYAVIAKATNLNTLLQLKKSMITPPNFFAYKL